tara:strand:+ start:593 stop:985 length:393 start_codon:yes stop_codon:yes gene_type:complete
MSPLAPSTASPDPLEIEIDRFDSLEFEYHAEIEIEIEIETEIETETEIEIAHPLVRRPRLSDSIDAALVLATARLDSTRVPPSVSPTRSTRRATRRSMTVDRPPSFIIIIITGGRPYAPSLSLHIYYKKY